MANTISSEIVVPPKGPDLQPVAILPSIRGGRRALTVWDIRETLGALAQPKADAVCLFRNVGGIDGLLSFFEPGEFGLSAPEALSHREERLTLSRHGPLDYASVTPTDHRTPQIVLVSCTSNSEHGWFLPFVRAYLLSLPRIARRAPPSTAAAMFMGEFFDTSDMHKTHLRRMASPVIPEGDTEWRFDRHALHPNNVPAVTAFAAMTSAIGNASLEEGGFDVADSSVLAFTGKTHALALLRHYAAPSLIGLHRLSERTPDPDIR